jgi:hypothetical protein
MHFYHQENSFCNPPEQFRTNAEMEYPSVLPQQMPPLPPQLVDASENENDYDVPCWLVNAGDLVVPDTDTGGPLGK